MEASGNNLTTPASPAYEEHVHAPFSLAVSAVIGVGASLMILLTTLGNSFTLVVFARRKSLRKFGDFLIINLAVADLAIGVMCMPPYVPYLLTGSWQGGQAYCKFWLLWDYTTPAASTFCICIISLDRYLLVVHPLLYRRVQSKRLLVVMLASPWGVSVLLYGSSILLWEVNFGVKIAQGDCYVPYFDNFPFLLFASFMEFILPFSIVAVTNVLLVLSIRARMSRKIAHSPWPPVITTAGRRPLELVGGQGMSSEQKDHNAALASSIDVHPSHPSQESSRGCHVRRSSEELNVAKGGVRLAGENEKERSLEEIAVQALSIEPRKTGKRHSKTGTALVVGAGTNNASTLDPRTCDSATVDSRTGSALTVSSKMANTSASERGRINLFTAETRTGNIFTIDFRTTNPCTVDASAASVCSGECRTGNPAPTMAPSTDSPLSQRRRGSNLKVARSLFVLVVVFALCWMPYEVVAIIRASCSDCVNPEVFEVAFWLLWFNSTLNPVLYPILHKRFREVAISVLRGWCARGRGESRGQTR